MKKLFAILFVVALSSCQFVVPSGNVGILYDMYGSEKGVQVTAYKPGKWAYNPSTQEYKIYPTYTVTVKYQDTTETEHDEGIDFAAKDGNSVGMDIAVMARTDETHAPILFQTFRDELEDTLTVQVKQRVRDYFNQYATSYTVEDIYGEKRTELLARVEDSIKKEFEPKGIIIEQLSYLTRPRFSAQVAAAIENKIVTQQDTLNANLRVTKAMATANELREKAKGEADANITLSRSINPEILRLKELQNQELFIKALSEGKASMPSTYVTGGNNQTLIPLK